MAQLLVDIGQGSGPGGSGVWPVFTSAIPDAPDEVLAVWDTTGISDGRFNATGNLEQHYGVQITVRSTDHPRGWLKAAQVRAALSAVLDQTVTVGGNAFRLPAVTRLDPVLVVGRDKPNSNRTLFTLNPTFALHLPGE
jgi:Bacteriophage minor capsid protein